MKERINDSNKNISKSKGKISIVKSGVEKKAINYYGFNFRFYWASWSSCQINIK